MKKIFTLVLIALMVCGVAFAIDPQYVYIKGNVPDGYINPGDNQEIEVGENPIADDGAIKIYARVIPNGDVTPTPTEDDLSWNGATPLSDFSTSESYKAIDLLHNDDTNDVESLVIVYAVIGNLSENAQPSASVTVSHNGWVLENATSPSSDLTLTLASTGMSMTESVLLLKGAVTNNSANSNTIEVQRVEDNTAAGVITSAPLIGYTAVTWGVNDTATPPAGDYKATITIGVDSEG